MKPILCMDFDGVIHSYESGWISATFIPDKPVPGAFKFIIDALDADFDVKIYSSRSKEEGGIKAMREWMEYWARRELSNDNPSYLANHLINKICYNKDAWPMAKPAAFLTIDDRAWQFDGVFPSPVDLLKFKPWNKR